MSKAPLATNMQSKCDPGSQLFARWNQLHVPFCSMRKIGETGVKPSQKCIKLRQSGLFDKWNLRGSTYYSSKTSLMIVVTPVIPVINRRRFRIDTWRVGMGDRLMYLKLDYLRHLRKKKMEPVTLTAYATKASIPPINVLVNRKWICCHLDRVIYH